MRETTLPAALRYDPTSLWLHWASAILVLLLWCLGETIDWFPSGFPRIAVRSLHICLGVVLGTILCYRIWWRAGAGRHLPPAGTGILQVLAATTHVALYALLIATVALGLANVWVRGDNIFDLFTVPAFDPGNKVLRKQVEELHALSANILLGLAAFHASASLWHHFLRKDDVLRRVLPERW
jgi:cytochrome b561